MRNYENVEYRVYIMNLEIKYGGEGYKYKDICTLFGDNKASGGKDRDAQLRKWQKKYEIDKVGTRYIIQRELLPEEIELMENNGKFTTYIQNLLVWKLKQQENHEVRFGYKDIFEYMNIVNGRYYSIKYGEERLEYTFEAAEITSTNPNSINDYLDIFYEYSNRTLKRMVRDSLNSMAKRNLIIYYKSYRLFRKVYIQETKKWKIERHECTNEEVAVILGIYVDTMKKFGLKEERFIYIMDEVPKREFYRIIDEQISERFGYDYHRETFKIILSEGIDKGYPHVLTQKRLNENVQIKLDESVDLNKMIPKIQLEMFIKDLISM